MVSRHTLVVWYIIHVVCEQVQSNSVYYKFIYDSNIKIDVKKVIALTTFIGFSVILIFFLHYMEQEERRVRNPVIGLTQPHCCVCPKPGYEFPTS